MILDRTRIFLLSPGRRLRRHIGFPFCPVARVHSAVRPGGFGVRVARPQSELRRDRGNPDITSRSHQYCSLGQTIDTSGSSPRANHRLDCRGVRLLVTMVTSFSCSPSSPRMVQLGKDDRDQIMARSCPDEANEPREPKFRRLVVGFGIPIALKGPLSGVRRAWTCTSFRSLCPAACPGSHRTSPQSPQ